MRKEILARMPGEENRPRRGTLQLTGNAPWLSVKDRPSRLFGAEQETVQRSLGGTGSALSWWLKCGRRDAACC